MSAGITKLNVKVTEIKTINDLVKRFRFEATDGALLPTFSGGAHTVIEMNDNGTRRLNPYSLMSDPNDRSAYMVSVRREDKGRGGSLYMHNQVKLGQEMIISNPVNLFSLDLRARKHIMIAGGIGITPFMAQIEQLTALGQSHYELHYAVRSKALGSYSDELISCHPHRVHVYSKELDQKLDIDHILDGQPAGSHVYVCGPKGMIEAVRAKAKAAGWPEPLVHHEEFLAPEPGQAFDVHLAQSNISIHVDEKQSLLEAIEAAGVEAPYLCRGGACGMCETNVIEADGAFLHKDHWLDEDEQQSGKKIMPCVSRFIGKTLVLER